MARKHTVRASTRKWSVHLFHNTLDLAVINAWVMYKEITNCSIRKRLFLQQLAEELSRSHSAKTTRFLQKISSDKDQSKITKFCQVKKEYMKNCTVESRHECSRSLCGQCTAETQRLCINCSHLLLLFRNYLPFLFGVAWVSFNKTAFKNTIYLC